MDEEIVDTDEVEEIVGVKGERNTKPVSIISDGKQMSIRIPKEYVDNVGITSEDKFEFEQVLKEDGTFDLIGRVIKHG